MSGNLVLRSESAGALAPVSAFSPFAGAGVHAPTRKPPTRTAMWIGTGALVVFFGGFLAWATLAPLAEAAIAPGVIKAEGSRRSIQHLEGGIVREILVRDGDRVTAGQVLMRLDDTQSGSTTESARAARWSLLAQDARLSAEIRGQDSITFPQELLTAANTDPRAADAVQGQKVLFESRLTNLRSQSAILQTRIDQAQHQIHSGQAQIESLTRQVALIRDEMQSVNELLRLGLERRPRLLALQRTEASLVGNRSDAEAQNARAEAQAAEARGQVQQLGFQRIQESSLEIRDVRAKLIETEERLRAVTDISHRREIVAPEDGTILNAKFFTVGAVLRPGDTVFDLTPARDRLIAEVNVQPHDIDIVHLGQNAEARLPAFKQRLVSEILGEVIFVAPDITIDDRTRQSYYRVQVRLSEQELARLPAGLHLVSGMPVEVHINAGHRTFMQYLLQPLIDSFSRAFKEQ